MFYYHSIFFGTFRIRKVIISSLILIASWVLIFSYMNSSETYNWNIIGIKNNKNREFLINTEGCQIEYLEPWANDAKTYFKKKDKMDCAAAQTIRNLTRQENEFIVFKHDNLKKFIDDGLICAYRIVLRKENSDFGLILKDEISIDLRNNNKISMKDKEFVQVYCKIKKNYVYENFYTYIEKRKTKPINKSKSLNYNIMLVGIDSTSRNNLIRTMPRVYNFVKEKLNGLVYDGFVKIAGYTLGNIGVLLRGELVQNWKDFEKKPYLDVYRYIFQDFADNGYATMIMEDDTYTSMFKSSVRGFKKQPTLHFGLPIATAGHKGFLKKETICFGQKSTVKMLTDYTLQFIDTYKDQPWWSHTHQTMWSHGSLSGISAIEDDYLSFFEKIHEKNIMKNTLLIFHSDHGNRFGDFRRTYNGRVEEHLPFMIVIPPKHLIDNYPELYKNMQANVDKLTTFFDLHKTLFHLLNFYDERIKEKLKKKKGISWLHPVPENRTCDSAPMRSTDCICKKLVKVSIDAQIVQQSVKISVDHMNGIIDKKNMKKKCEKLKLKKIHSAFALFKQVKGGKVLSQQELVQSTENTYAKLTLAFELLPSNGIFEAMVGYAYDSKKFNVLGTIDRITKYGNESDCTNIRELRGICLCKNL